MDVLPSPPTPTSLKKPSISIVCRTAYTARYNIAPTQPVAVITNQNSKALDFFTWGLIPSWSKDTSIGSKLINARSETAHEKPSFRAAFKRRRCLIPADGFYEWTKRDNKKIPMYVHLKDRKPFAFAGLWEIWQSKEGDEIRSCTILTTEPNDLIKPLHHRMAVISYPNKIMTCGFHQTNSQPMRSNRFYKPIHQKRWQSMKSQPKSTAQLMIHLN